ncbi:hypothetical protein N9I30_01875 [Flavobacteriales bacterium]|jgi:hypothetical protein|nr:hypothetical protein [Flavobacteriales bacterium]
MNTLSEYNKFTILGPPMKTYGFIILFSVLIAAATKKIQYNTSFNFIQVL